MQNGVVVVVPNGCPFNLLLGILSLFCLEDQLVDVILQALIGIIDAKLFEAVLGKVFETKEVEKGNNVLANVAVHKLLLLSTAGRAHHFVDSCHQPCEEG